ncbi:class I SAM-dependent methyltransferase [Clostridium sp. SHJSY1]|uniref:tRNA (adenine(22)-N(1))-methyltransferase n=1 Tax=Clostridium sp. SHJSY1 TaxID=2942483 RepID=UPI0028765EFB|nr:class I SAM-dependent methyltransferase [Clostridium sp. SHJSY1]MDS0524037.1 class I SAM-dependent methyltransferase [Clostridium sp. SHJSY1]
MELSKRLMFIVNHIDKCDSIIDVGTDHGYIPIYVVKKGLCERAIASDINKEPVKKAKLNVTLENLEDKIEVRLGGGLETVKKGEVESVVVAGMGGNLIRDILENDKEKVLCYKFLILQPAQNPEVLREYLYSNGYEVMQEDLCLDEGIYYELFKVRKSNKIEKIELESIFYEISPILLREKHELMNSYLESKREKYERISGFIKDDSESANKRRNEIEEKLSYIKKFKLEVSKR